MEYAIPSALTLDIHTIIRCIFIDTGIFYVILEKEICLYRDLNA